MDIVGSLTMSWGSSNCSSSPWNGLGKEIELRAPPWLEVEEDLEVAISSVSGEVEGMVEMQQLIAGVLQQQGHPPSSSSPPSSSFLLLLFFLSSLSLLCLLWWPSE
jgi:hypothetical protein